MKVQEAIAALEAAQDAYALAGRAWNRARVDYQRSKSKKRGEVFLAAEAEMDAAEQACNQAHKALGRAQRQAAIEAGQAVIAAAGIPQQLKLF